MSVTTNVSAGDQLAARRAALSDAQKALFSARLRRGSASAPDAVEIPRRVGNGPARLSFAQQRLWFLDQLVPGNPFYNIPAALPLNFAVKLDDLRWTLNEIVRRHEVLRTTYQTIEGEARQVISTDAPFDLPVIDLRGMPREEREAEAARIGAEEARQPFDLRTGPVIRAKLLRLGDSQYTLLLTIHHISADGWSMGILIRELGALYQARAFRRPSPLEPLPIQYSDFAEWQRDWLAGENLQMQLAYWRRQLDELPVLRMPTDKPRPPISSFRGRNHAVRVGEELTRRVRQQCKAEGVTPFMFFLAVFNLVLHRYTGQTDVVIGAPIANRNRRQVEPLIGFFVNSLVLRTDLSGDPAFSELVQRVRSVTLEAYAHQDLPFEKLVEELQPERDLSRNPLTQVTLQLQNTPTATGELPEEEQLRLDLKQEVSILDIAFTLWETRTSFVGTIQYDTELFEEPTIAGLFNHFLVALGEVTANPEIRLSQVNLLSKAERILLTEGVNETQVLFETGLCLHQLFERSARAHADETAIRWSAGSATYRDLDALANVFGQEILARAKPGSIIALCIDRSPELVAAMLGTLKAGCGYLPVDTALPARRIHGMLEDARAALVIASAEIAPRLAPAAPVYVVPSGATEWRKGEAPSMAVAPRDVAYVIFTSGSTGRPKGVAIPHEAIVNHMLWMQREFPFRAADRVLQRTPIHFDASVWEFYAPLLAGATLVLPPPHEKADAGAVIQAIQEYGVTVLQTVPSLLNLLVREPGFAGCSSLRRVFAGGEELKTQLVRQFFELLEAELVNLYGPTEATIDATFWRCQDEERLESTPLGRPIDNLSAYVLDERLEPVPAGVVGELYLGGIGLACGYIHRPDLTDERFIPSPFRPGERLYRTGDLVRRRRDGVLLFGGRRDDQVKVRGFRVELGEIEKCLAEHASVMNALVTVRANSSLVAYVQLNHAQLQESSDRQQIESSHIDTWQAVYREIYGKPGSEGTDDTFNIVGWNSSYTGQPLAPVEMREWTDRTVDRIRRLAPRRILELGGGTGLLYFPLAGACEEYASVDFSAEALALLRRAIDASPGPLPAAKLLHRRAHEIEDLPERHFDAVVLNSVVQYFPSSDYLLDVIAKALKKCAPDGSIFIGDVRNLALLAAFHTSVELHSAPEATAPETIRARVEKRVREEKELVIEPGFFLGLPRLFPSVVAVEIRPKRGVHRNELTRFRYDVVLRLGRATSLAEYKWVDWRRQGLDGRSMRELLNRASAERIAFGGIPNLRTAGECAYVAAMFRGDFGSCERAMADALAGAADPEELVQIANECGYSADLRWFRSPADGAFDLICQRGDPSGIPVEPAVPVNLGRDLPLNRFTNLPVRQEFARLILPSLKEHLAERLPEYMQPSRFIVIDSVPLKPNGKVDKEALPEPDLERPLAPTGYVAPATAVQQVLAGLWADVLSLHSVGIKDNFFADLGGHSLLATQMISRLRETFQMEIPLRLAFEAPTIEQLEAALETLGGSRVAQVAELILRVQNMDPDEVQAMLASRNAATAPAP